MYKSINDIKVGKVDNIIVLVKSITPQRAKNGTLYQKVCVRDQSGIESTFMQFDVLLDVQTPLIMDMNVECVEYGSSASFKIQECRETNEYPIEMFMPKAKIDAKAGWSKVVKITKQLRPSICRVLCAVIADDKNKFLSLPLNPTGAFARNSGILEATLKLAGLAETAARQDTRLDHDLMVAGALLYYIGGVDTINEGYEDTVTGVMYGKSIAAYTKVQMKAAELIASNEDAKKEISSEDIMMLSHILAVGNMGVQPAIPEAAALVMLSKMISEIDAMEDAISNGVGSLVVDANAKNRKLYKRSTQSGQNN